MLTRNRREALAGQALALVEGSDTALTLEGQAQTLLRQSVSATCNSPPHLHFSSRSQPSPPPRSSTASPLTAQLCQELGRATTAREALQECGSGRYLGQAAQRAS